MCEKILLKYIRLLRDLVDLADIPRFVAFILYYAAIDFVELKQFSYERAELYTAQ